MDGEEIELLKYSSTVLEEDLNENVCSSNTNGFSSAEISSAPALPAPLLHSPSSAELYVDEDTEEPPESRIMGGVPWDITL